MYIFNIHSKFQVHRIIFDRVLEDLNIDVKMRGDNGKAPIYLATIPAGKIADL